MNVRKVNAGYELDEDAHKGFVQAVNTQRPILAMQYAVTLIDELTARVASLEEKLENSITAKPAPKASTVKPKTTEAPVE